MFVIVYPPRSMDAEELAMDLDNSILGGFMSSYAPVPGHLRRRRGVVEGGDRSDELDVLDGDLDAAGSEEEPGEDDEDVLEPDPSDEVLLEGQAGVSDTGLPTAGSRRVRRRLMKGGLHVSSVEDDVGLSEKSTLNIPVSWFGTCLVINIDVCE